MIYVPAGGTPWSPGRHEAGERHSHFTFGKLNFMSHSDQSKWQQRAAACWYITTLYCPSLPPATHLFPSSQSWRSASQPTPCLSPPNIELGCFLNANKATVGGEKKRLKRDMFWSIIKQVFDAKAKKNSVPFKKQYLCFWRKETQTATTCRQEDNCRMEDKETGDGNVLGLFCAELSSAQNWCEYSVHAGLQAGEFTTFKDYL